MFWRVFRLFVGQQMAAIVGSYECVCVCVGGGGHKLCAAMQCQKSFWPLAGMQVLPVSIAEGSDMVYDIKISVLIVLWKQSQHLKSK